MHVYLYEANYNTRGDTRKINLSFVITYLMKHLGIQEFVKEEQDQEMNHAFNKLRKMKGLLEFLSEINRSMSCFHKRKQDYLRPVIVNYRRR